MTDGNDIEFLRGQERAEREASEQANTVEDRDIHFLAAERFADQIWSLEEQS